MRELNQIMDAKAIGSAIANIADGIASNEGFDPKEVAFLGIRRRGIPLAQRIANHIAHRYQVTPPIGELDITLYRDDLSQKADQPIVGVTHVPYSVDGKIVVLVDDVIFTGRTIRAAMSALSDYGRPRAVWLAVLVDRGWRELPVHPDFVGITCKTRRENVIEVKINEIDQEERVSLMELE
jgi:pyrimidine operon attenuation protein / uracil phosphoribosyltransferase